jgi:hypothetical protein
MAPHAVGPISEVYVKLGKVQYVASAANTLKVAGSTVEAVTTAVRHGSTKVKTNEIVPVGVKGAPSSATEFI